MDGDFAGDGFLAQGFLQCGYQVEDGDGVAVADVVDTGGGGGDGGLAAVPVGGALGGMVDHADYRFGDIVDVGKVAFHVAVVVEVDGVSVEDGAGEGEQGHVGPAPGAVDGKEAEAGRRDAEQVRVAVRHQFVGALGGGVQADRVVGGAGFGERYVAVEAVHRAG